MAQKAPESHGRGSLGGRLSHKYRELVQETTLIQTVMNKEEQEKRRYYNDLYDFESHSERIEREEGRGW